MKSGQPSVIQHTKSTVTAARQNADSDWQDERSDTDEAELIVRHGQISGISVAFLAG